jgi:hypothetical protein
MTPSFEARRSLSSGAHSRDPVAAPQSVRIFRQRAFAKTGVL